MTNDKIKMAQKNGVQSIEPNPIEDLVRAAKEEDLSGVVAAIIAIKDEEFDDIASVMYKNLDKLFNSQSYRNKTAQRIELMDDVDFEREREGYEGLQGTIDELELSESKKKFLKYLFDHSYEAILRYQKDPSEHITVVYKKLSEDAIVPTYAHLGDAGADLYASEDCTAKVGEVTFVHTGIAMKIPKGYEGQVRPRSGLSAKTKIRVANAPGTIDSNYRGEVCILVDNYGSAPFIIKKGDRIAQIVFNKVPTADFVEGEVESEEDNTRGDKGFGSSGVSE